MLAVWQTVTTVASATLWLSSEVGPTLLGVWQLSGWAAKAYIACLSLLWLWASAGLWCLSEVSRRLSIGLYAWVLLNNAAVAIGLLIHRPRSPLLLIPSWVAVCFVYAAMAVVAGLIIRHLMRHKAAFATASTSA